jgi:hypothetical protein
MAVGIRPPPGLNDGGGIAWPPLSQRLNLDHVAIDHMQRRGRNGGTGGSAVTRFGMPCFQALIEHADGVAANSIGRVYDVYQNTTSFEEWFRCPMASARLDRKNTPHAFSWPRLESRKRR